MALNRLVAAGLLLVPLWAGTAVAHEGQHEGLPETVHAGAAEGTEICWTVSDSTPEGRDSDGPDALHRIVRTDADPTTNETTIGEGTGTFNIEALALHPQTSIIYAANAGTLGILDPTTGKFTAVGEGIGSGEGSAGTVRFDDVDGLNFDPETGILYGSQRERRDNDMLLQIDPATGEAVSGAFGGDDYVVVEDPDGLHDIDDLAIDPTDGQMYAIANDDGRRDHLVTIDKATGAVTDVGSLGVDDMEGLSFSPEGQLIGSTGKVHGREAIWDLDKTSGAASNERPLDNADDYESLACKFTPAAPLPPPAPTPEPPVAEPVREPMVTPEPAPVPPPVVAGVVEDRQELPRTGPGDGLLALLAGGLFVGGGFCVAASARARAQR